MKVFDNKVYLILFAILLFLFFLGNVSFGEKINKCLLCHKIKKAPKVLENGEKLTLYVNPQKYKASVHGNIDCIFCHLEIGSNHPKPIKIKSRREYINQISKNCIKCHPPVVISKSPAHAKIIKRKDVTCADCHGSHYIKSIKNWKKAVSTSNYCLMCHRFKIVKTLPNGEKISLKVYPLKLKNSVHGKVGCASCHYDFSKTRHPVYNFKSKKIYEIKLSKKICQRCHTDEKLKKNPAHYTLSRTSPCIKCHGYHNVKPAKLAKVVSISDYCLNCHSRELYKKMQNGEILSLKVNKSQILNSVHKRLVCSDCHKGFSVKTHPIKTYRSIAEFRKKAQEICNNCHKKEVNEYINSAHAIAKLRGNKKAPDCLSCHGYHKVIKITNNISMRYNLCVKCHTKEDKVYKDSIHYKAFEKGRKNAPVCSSCHGAHKVLPVNIADISKACVNCHKGVKVAHNKWLYNPPFKLVSFVDVHFKGSSCAVCHTSADKAVVLTLVTYDNKPLTIEELAKLTHWKEKDIKAKLDLNRDNLVQKEELWQFIKLVKEKTEAALKGRLDVVNANNAHKILSKNRAIKNCATCHDPEAKFVGRLEINEENGKVERIALEKSAVNSAYAIPNIKDFYVLGLTKISLLDLLFVVALIAGAGVVIGHVSLRIITIPVRRKRREGR